MSHTAAKGNVKATGIASRVKSLDWQQVESDLDAYGCAIAKGILLPEQCGALSALYGQNELFRSRIAMARHGFGRGEYKYWAYPLPEAVATLRSVLYPNLSNVANRWNKVMGIAVTVSNSATASAGSAPATGTPSELFSTTRNDPEINR